MSFKTVGVTFGDGVYAQFVGAWARRFEELNGLQVIQLDIEQLPPMPGATWAKAWIWDLVPRDVDRVVWFDADAIPIAPLVDLLPHPEVVFAAVPDMYRGGRQVAEWNCPEAEALPQYFNMGVFVANRETASVFWAARQRMFEREWGHGDQTPVNLALFSQLGLSQIDELPRRANWMTGFGNPPPEDIRMLHLAGMKSGGLRTTLMQAFMQCFEPLTAKELAEKGGASCSGSWALQSV